MKNIIFYLVSAFIVIAAATEINSSQLYSRIVGGRDAIPNSKGFMASLRITEKHICCGFLITKRIVISTGYCVNYIKLLGGSGLANATVFLGNINLMTKKRKEIAKIDHVDYHPNYKPLHPKSTSDFDVGYVLLEKQLSIWKGIKVIGFSRMGIRPQMKGETYGWGCEKISKPKIDLCEVPMSTILKRIGVRILANEQCRYILAREMNTHEMCARGIGKGVTAAQGDAGSPLVIHEEVIGITTIVNIKKSRHPIIFMDVHHILPFIDKVKEDFPDENTTNFEDENTQRGQEESNQIKIHNVN